jgi:hypothetical protein
MAILLAAAATAQAQQGAPSIGYVYPAGGRQGATFQVTVGGQFLNNMSKACFTGAGITAKFVKHERQLTPKEQDDLKLILTTLQDKRQKGEKLTLDEDKQLVEVRTKLTQFGRRLPNPAISEFVTLDVTLAADAAAGDREVRLMTPGGLSNPLVFRVGVLPEYAKDDWKNVPVARFNLDPKTPAPAETSIKLPAVLNGQMQPGVVDRYKFDARQGQHIVIITSARELIPYIADAVPGWFEAAVTLYDAAGHELAYADHFRARQDPVLHYEVLKDGQYVLEVKDTLYRGREDFIYRISLGELPYITDVFPLGGRAGAATTVALTGWNLPVASLTQDAKDKKPGVYPLDMPKAEAIANTVPFAVDALPEVLEAKPNAMPANAQAVTLPVIVNGRVERAGEASVFRFEGRAGDEVVAEVVARRLGSPLDSVLRLTDAAGKQVAFNDDHEDKGAGLETHHADSYFRVKLPDSGTYFLYLSDVQRQAGPEYAYRLRLGAPRPDYELRVTPASVNVRGGGSVPITVHALRNDGFAGAIELTLKDAPAGFKLNGGNLPANADLARLTLTAPAASPGDPVTFTVEGRAKIAGADVVRKAAPAEDMEQAFAYHHLVLAREMDLEVTSRAASRANIQILSPLPVKIAVGQTARVRIGLPPNTRFGGIEFELSDPPEGISIQSAGQVGLGTDLVLVADAAKAKPGLKGNLIVNVFLLPAPPATAPASAPAITPPGSPTTRPAGATTAPAKPPATNRRLALGSLPAIPFEIIP